MRRLTPILRATFAVALGVMGCTNAGENRVTGISGTGMVDGFVRLDANGTRVIDAGDDSLANVKVRLVLNGTSDTGLVEVTPSSGFFRFTDVPVGVYTLNVDTTGFADTLQVVRVDSLRFTVTAGDSVRINALIGLPLLTVRQARLATVGRRIFIVGVALSSSAAFADSTANVADTSGSIRVARARSSFAAGDSLRFQGTVGSRAGEPTLDDPTVVALGQGRVPSATALTTAQAAAADGGTRDAALVSVHGAIISDTVRTSTSFVLTASDSSGPLAVQLDRTADSSFLPAKLPGDFVPGSKFDVVGVLVPTGTGTWRLRPRSAADLTETLLPAISVAAARRLTPGHPVVVVGVALNGSGTFADTTVFLTDTSGAVQLTRLRTSVAAGDSVRVQALTALRNGQPVLDGGTTTALGRGNIPTATSLTTAVAATAAAGTRDAQLVAVHAAIISDTARTATSFVLTVSDGSGALQVQLDRTADPTFQPASLPADFVPGNEFDVLGVLAATNTGTWRLRPRSAGDLTEIPVPVISIAAARLLPVGANAVVVGVALNSSGTFSDSLVDLADTSGAIRLTRLRTTVAAGDSVRVRGMMARRLGEPTLDGGTTTALGRGFYPTAATLTTAVAATAAGGTRDAQLVVVPNAVVSDTGTVLGNYRLTVSDGSGTLIVVLDRLAGFTVPGVYLKTATFDVVGLLAPTGTGSWVLEPRAPADLVKH